MCADYGWYNDQFCDQSCRNPDPDCAGAITLRARHNNGVYIVNRATDVLVQLQDGDYAGGQEWRVTSTDRSFGYAVETLRADDFVQFRWKTEGLFDLTGVHDVEMTYGPSAATFAFGVDVR